MPSSSLNRINLFKNKFFVTALKVLGVCGACFMIEACYGTPQADPMPLKPADVDISGTLRANDGSVLSNARVMLTRGRYSDTLSTYTDEQGHYCFYDVPYVKERFLLVVDEGQSRTEKSTFLLDESDALRGSKKLEIL